MQNSDMTPLFSRSLERSPRYRAYNNSKSNDEKGEIRTATSERETTESFEGLFDLCKMSGVKMDRKVFRNIVDLVRLNIHPDDILKMLKKIEETQEENIKESVTDEDILQENEIEVSLI